MKKHVPVVTVVASMVLVAVLLVPAVSSGLALQEDVEIDSPQRTVSVSGSGQISAQPDAAVVTLGVQTDADQAATALTENSQQMRALVDVLKRAGIAAEDLQTRVVQLQPRYGDKSTEGGQPDLIGYTATNLVLVHVRDLDTLGDILDAAVQAGGNRIEGISFEISEATLSLDQAREAAWSDAQHKAEQLASLAGARLGQVLTISESSQGPQPIAEQPRAAELAAGVPIEPGSQTVNVNLQVTWSLEEEE